MHGVAAPVRAGLPSRARPEPILPVGRAIGETTETLRKQPRSGDPDRACCFEVGPEVVAAFCDALGEVPRMVVAGPHKDHIDLRVATRTVLERAGVAPDHIDDRPPCTRCEPERFFSYRRDGRAGGIHMSFIGLV